MTGGILYKWISHSLFPQAMEHAIAVEISKQRKMAAKTSPNSATY